MELYTTIASWAGWPAVVALFLVAIGFGLWMHKKESDIWKEQKTLLESQLETAKQKDPDILYQSLAERYDRAIKELEQIKSEKNVPEKTLAEKVDEILKLQKEMAELKPFQNQETQRANPLDKYIGGTVTAIQRLLDDPAYNAKLGDLSPFFQELQDEVSRNPDTIQTNKEPPKP